MSNSNYHYRIRMKYLSLFLIFNFYFLIGSAQTPKRYTSSEILLQLKKLNVLGSVLYMAAHPDDENTRLLAYLANEKLYRTGYLSLTRGDGGQNLIGDEQGVDLGLIRTQELLAARRIDGAEQFFSTAFDFGYSKSPEEALRIWNHDKILSDAVWVIRKFRPDVIITRFPTTGEGGHGHHTASAIIAGEAFDAAADPTKFPEQLKLGVTVWQAKRLLWNTFNFGSTNTQNDNQFKLDCGDYNPVLGKSYGEIAAESRSQHKSQGFGVPAQRGVVLEYFKTIKGDAPVNDLMDGVNTGWDRTLSGGELQSRPLNENNIENAVSAIIKNFDVTHPERSVTDLTKIYARLSSVNDVYWKTQKQKELLTTIEACSGLFMEATTPSQLYVQGDSIKINLVINNRLGINIKTADVHIGETYYVFNNPKKNINSTTALNIAMPDAAKITQPYWLRLPMDKGHFNVNDQALIGMAENEPPSVEFSVNIEGTLLKFLKPIRYKYTDPVKGELYQPIHFIPVAEVKYDKDVYLAKSIDSLTATVKVISKLDKPTGFNINETAVKENTEGVQSNEQKIINTSQNGNSIPVRFTVKDKSANEVLHLRASAQDRSSNNGSGSYNRMISYDHIPSIVYQKDAAAKAVFLDLKTEGHLVGYIPGAGDKIPEALIQMGYKVVVLTENDLVASNLKQFDAIVTGVRAYNTQEWLSNAYEELMTYIKEGGVLLVQYNTNNSIGPVKAKIAPYPFTIGRSRITDEEAKVNFLLPDHPALNYPNKITQKDFEGWIQERSTYHAEGMDSNYKRILSMKDPGEVEQDGSLVIANYGAGRFVYAGLVFFRELPAGVPGAYRLFANLIANKRTKYIK
ncbi:MAG: PIG-L family deacetylase [Ferruginibacter sp.]